MKFANTLSALHSPMVISKHTAFSLERMVIYRVSLIGRESAGWCPEYSNFTTAMRFGKGSWWFHVASWIGGDQYGEVLSCDIELNPLTVDSYIAF